MTEREREGEGERQGGKREMEEKHVTRRTTKKKRSREGEREGERQGGKREMEDGKRSHVFLLLVPSIPPVEAGEEKTTPCVVLSFLLVWSFFLSLLQLFVVLSLFSKFVGGGAF